MIDTREKIVTQPEARLRAATGDLRVVASFCDPLLPPLVRGLRELAGARRLLLIIDSPPDAYLDARARAEIAASLEFVEAVVIGDAALAQSLKAIRYDECESVHRAQFVEHVRQKVGS